MKNGNYILVVSPKGYPGKRYRGKYVYQHQLAWWINTGELVPDGYVIHHKNEDRHDNHFENLEMIERKIHAVIHKPGYGFIELVCDICGKTFQRSLSMYNRKQRFLSNHGLTKSKTCCSKTCAGKVK